MFCREKNAEREIWDGFRFGPAAAKQRFAFDETYAISELDKLMPDLLADQPAVYTHLGQDSAWDARVLGWVNEVRNRARTGVAAPRDIADVHTLLDDLRLIKDADELATMRQAAKISTGAHVRANVHVHVHEHVHWSVADNRTSPLEAAGGGAVESRSHVSQMGLWSGGTK